MEHWSSPAGCHPDCPACEAPEKLPTRIKFEVSDPAMKHAYGLRVDEETHNRIEKLIVDKNLTGAEIIRQMIQFAIKYM